MPKKNWQLSVTLLIVPKAFGEYYCNSFSHDMVDKPVSTACVIKFWPLPSYYLPDDKQIGMNGTTNFKSIWISP